MCGNAHEGYLSQERVRAVCRTADCNMPTEPRIATEMSASLPPNVSIPDDILAQPWEEHIQLAIAAIWGSGTNLMVIHGILHGVILWNGFIVECDKLLTICYKNPYNTKSSSKYDTTNSL